MRMLGWGLAATAAACAYRGFLVEPWRIGVSRLELAIPGLPPWLARARILFLTDLHTSGWGYREHFIADVLARTPPDLLFITGDLISKPNGIPIVLELLANVRPPHGVYFVAGNNEVEELPDRKGFEDRLRGMGWTVLINEHVVVSHPEGNMVVAGVDDPNSDLDDLPKALEGIPPGAFTVLLSHTPETFPDAAAGRIPLVLSGHTHGGQVRVPGFGALWTDTPRTGLRYSAGVYREGDSTMVLSRGIGWSLLPLRFWCTPEVIELVLRPVP
jgi:predicted MPP superfamily phosphohydrolase